MAFILWLSPNPDSKAQALNPATSGPSKETNNSATPKGKMRTPLTEVLTCHSAPQGVQSSGLSLKKRVLGSEVEKIVK